MSPQPGYQIPGRAPVEPFPDSGYWNQKFTSEPYFLEGDSYDDYDAAYRLGYGARRRYADRDFNSLESDLQHEWETSKGPSRLDWNRARQAVLRAWERGEPHGT
ncbi:hypothetical protein [Pseudoxanthomonas suwonensis]|uniref:Uncharacterized protein n=1 Tax=Pseudoxanthomonas suwonensis TaxID=314722 RepID=A0A0E3UNF2_9GAMM|nr:hypothetical protein [Pseudoxanthomonas suwonensis]AKC87116.1 hypothetical protein WQ53_10530 [Pseudoxanthomonas suwonensis]